MKTDLPYQTLFKAALTALLGISMMFLQTVQAELLDPDCTVEKAAKSAVAKATVGLGGRCSPTEAAKDTAKRTLGIEDKGPIEKLKNDSDDAAKRAVKRLVK